MGPLYCPGGVRTCSLSGAILKTIFQMILKSLFIGTCSYEVIPSSMSLRLYSLRELQVWHPMLNYHQVHPAQAFLFFSSVFLVLFQATCNH